MHQPVHNPGQGIPYSSSYSDAQSSFGLPQASINMPPQFQPSSQMPIPLGSTGAQPWMHSNQGKPSVVAPPQQGSQQSFPNIPAANGAQQSADWQEYEAAAEGSRRENLERNEILKEI